MFARQVLTLLATVAVLAIPATSQADSYGLDLVPGSNFFSHAWNSYGTDPVPSNTTLHSGLDVRYGLDGVPHVHHPHLDHHEHVLLIETFQQLTGGYEMTPRPHPFGVRRPTR